MRPNCLGEVKIGCKFDVVDGKRFVFFHLLFMSCAVLIAYLL